MGTCLSKKNTPSSSSSTTPTTTVVTSVSVSIPNNVVDQNKSLRAVAPEETVKKEVFLIKQRKSHERPPSPLPSGAAPVRTSSCTKEEVDAILIQCGRLSRSSSGNNNNEGGGRKYSGSKRSYDFDQENGNRKEDEDDERYGTQVVHRRTPSRERDGDYNRSGSRRHRSSSTSREEEPRRNAQNGGRRLSRSPGRRSETTTTSSSSGDKSKGPAKMVSVPASTTAGGAIKRISVKRATASPRSQSPAANARDPVPSLSRTSSRKAEQSPYRRNPLSEIDDNVPKSEQISKKPVATEEGGVGAKKPFNFQSQKPYDGKNEEELLQGNKLHQTAKGNESSKTITRSRSSRRSRDLDFVTNDDPPLPVNAPTSYASLLLEDIQNFHQKNSNSNSNNTATAFSLPPCVTKACSILDAVADLNSSTTSNISDDKTTHPIVSRSVSPFSAHSRKMSSEVVGKDPLVETEVFVYDDLMEPSVHKYITVRRGAAAQGVELELEQEQQESSGSNSIVGQQWFSSSWEPNSADSTDHWTSSCNTRDDVVVDKEEPIHKKKMFSESATRKLRSNGNSSTPHLASVSGKKRELDYHQQVGKSSAAASL